MATRLVSPLYQAFDNNGNVGSGFKLYFYETGTSTPKETFSDEALTIANTNPVVADSFGRFIDILGVSKDEYKAILTDSNDVEIRTYDPVDSITYNINSFNVRPAQFWGITTGTSSAYKIKPVPSITSYTNDLLFALEIHVDNDSPATLAVFEEGTTITYLPSKPLKKYDADGSKADVEAEDLKAGQRYDITCDGVDFVVLNIVPKSTTDSQGINYLSPNWGYGFVPSSNVATPDTNVDITSGKVGAKDGETILNLDSDETGLNLETLLGGALAVDTTYHLMRYLKSDDTFQWYISTNVDPSIGDIKSANAYRRILSVLTDSSGDIYRFYGFEIQGIGVHIRYFGTDGILAYDGGGGAPTTPTDLVIPVPTGIILRADMQTFIDTTIDANRRMYLTEKDSGLEFTSANVGDTSDRNYMAPQYIFTNTSAQIQHRRDSAGSVEGYKIWVIGYIDNRLI